MSEDIQNRVKNQIKVGLVQINSSFSGQNYIPYSVGILQSYAQKYLKNKNIFEFLLPIYKRIPIDVAVEKLLDANIIFFSSYIWNIKISLEIAKRIKVKNSEITIVFGGPQIPNKCEEFLRENIFIDISCIGEGEKSFLSILDNYETKDWMKVPSICYIDNKGIFLQTQTDRISNLDDIPSPYIEGIFEPLINENPEEKWIALFETNRGCPFECSYCAWNIPSQKKLYTYNIKRIYNEIDWFSRHNIEFIFCCDANFGILKRDIDIIKKFVENKIKYGYPKSLSVQNTKNSTMNIFDIYKLMSSVGLSKGVSLSLQSMNKETLESIRRKNISIDKFQDIQRKFNEEHIETFTDMIIGLPLETYETFADGVSKVIENGQHNRIQFSNLSILTNSEMDEHEYQERFGFDIIETKFINMHGSLDIDEVNEKHRIVIGTNSMPRNDWIKTKVFSWITSLLYFDKLLQIPFTILHKEYNINYRALIENFMIEDLIHNKVNKFPILSDLYLFFTDKAKQIQNGYEEYCKSKKWLDIWWPADELAMIKLCTENKLYEFYIESEELIIKFLERNIGQKNIKYCKSVLHEAIILNQNLIKMPFRYKNIEINLKYNIWDVYTANINGQINNIKEGNYCYDIDCTSSTWLSWKDWCREVIWYGNKKGAYMYHVKNTKIK